jgi:hypothetical protein
MALEYADRVLVECSTYDSDDFTIGTAVAGHQDFDIVGSGNTCFYRAAEVDADGIETGEFEIGYGEFDGTLLTRDKILLSSGTFTEPSFASIGSVAIGDEITSLATNAPSGVVAGDLLIAFVGMESGTVTATGWAVLPREFDPSVATFATILIRIADGTADDTPTLAFSTTLDATAAIIRVTGHSFTNVVDVIDGLGQASTATPALATVVTTKAKTLLLAMITQGARNWTADPSGWTQRLAQNGSSGTVMGLGIWTKSGATAGSYGGETATMNATFSSVAYTIAINGSYPKVTFSGDLRISLIATAAKLGRPDIQTFTSSGVWTKPLWGTETEVLCIGGGGGGGTGAGTAQTGVTRGGGGSGAGGVITNVLLKSSSLDTLVTVTVGAAGTGGTGAASGANGVAGGATSFGSHAYSAGGSAGGGASSSTGAAGAAVGTTGLFQQAGLAGVISVDGAAGNSGANSTTVQCPGGGSGGGYTGAAATNGGSGGGLSASGVTVNAVAGGAAGTVGASQNGGNGNSLEWLYGVPIGTGGGGGASSTTGVGGNGGNGGGYGAGGGGSGTSETSTSGNGGNGGAGICIVVSY